MINYEKLPQEFMALPQWVCWRYEERKNSKGETRKTKVLKTPSAFSYNGQPRNAKSDDPNTWRTFHQAVEAYRQHSNAYNGIGFVPKPEQSYVLIDIDDCISENGISPNAQQILERFGSTYAEKSVSGSGIHIICKGSITDYVNNTGSRTGKTVIGGIKEIEVYWKGRFFTFTGDLAGAGSDITESQAAIDWLFNTYPSLNKKAKQKEYSDPEKNNTKTQPLQDDPEEDETLFLLSMAEVIQNSKSGELFKKLYDQGDISDYPSQSEADLALMNLFPFYLHGDRELMRKMVTLSALGKRDKWTKRKEYQDWTIDKALASWRAEGAICYDPAAYRMNWPVTETNSKGQSVPLKVSWENVAYLLKRCGIMVRFNQVTKAVDFKGLDKVSFDSAVLAIRQKAHEKGLKIGRQDLIDALGLIAEREKYSPVCEYLTQCRQNWDGKKIYIDQLFRLVTLNKASGQDKDFCKTLLTKWLLTTVRAAFNEGEFTAQGMLILNGPQGIGKTRFKYMLLPDQTWAQEMSLDPMVKDDLLKAARYWIVELGEFKDTMYYRKIDRLKQYVTQSKDAIRPPYMRDTIEFPRKTSFIGTVNGGDFLCDHTGNRRYWSVEVDAIDIREDFPREQLWGQVMYMAFEEKAPAYLTKEELQKLEEQNAKFERVSEMEQLLLDSLAWDDPPDKWRKVTVTELCTEIGLFRTQNARLARVIRAMAKKDERIGLPTNNMGKKYKLPKCIEDNPF